MKRWKLHIWLFFYWWGISLLCDPISRLYLDSWACRKSWILWPCRRNRMTWSSSGCRSRRSHCTPTSYSSHPLRPYSLDQRERVSEGCTARMQATCSTYWGLLACLTNNKWGQYMKGEVGGLKVLFDFAPQSRYHASLHTHTHTYPHTCTHIDTLIYMLTHSCWAKESKAKSTVRVFCKRSNRKAFSKFQQSYCDSSRRQFTNRKTFSAARASHRHPLLTVIHWFENGKWNGEKSSLTPIICEQTTVIGYTWKH